MENAFNFGSRRLQVNKDSFYLCIPRKWVQNKCPNREINIYMSERGRLILVPVNDEDTHGFTAPNPVKPKPIAPQVPIHKSVQGNTVLQMQQKPANSNNDENLSPETNDLLQRCADARAAIERKRMLIRGGN